MLATDPAVDRAVLVRLNGSVHLEVHTRGEAMHIGERQGERRGLREGERQAQIRGILAVLHTRGFTVADVHTARLQACQDPARLSRWLVQAVTASSVDAALE